MSGSALAGGSASAANKAGVVVNAASTRTRQRRIRFIGCGVWGSGGELSWGLEGSIKQQLRPSPRCGCEWPARRWTRRFFHRRSCRSWRPYDGGDGRFDTDVGHDQFDFDLRQKVDRILGTAVDFGVAFLAAESL